MISPISRQLEPIDCPMPALFSMISQGPSGDESRTRWNDSTIWGSTVSNPCPLWLPTWKIVPLQPIFSAAVWYLISESTPLSTSSGFGEPRLMR